MGEYGITSIIFVDECLNTYNLFHYMNFKNCDTDDVSFSSLWWVIYDINNDHCDDVNVI